uniref:Panacea domain-containing protein n=1 Tax=Nitrospira cf. moscoviensis SBR1015 TaxID=96242 RepID=UPI00117CA2FE|nr:Panacea domain-containing protein [Nitrospira cf. moscoviensis SBR1015]
MQLLLNSEKAAQAGAFLVRIHGKPLDTIVLIKLLYFADRKALIDSGYTITGDGMVSMPLGPVLTTIYDWIQYGFKDSIPWYKYLSERTNHLISLVVDNPPVAELSEYEMEVLTGIHAKYGHLGPWEISDLAHALQEYQDPGSSSIPIDPNTILRNEGKSDQEIERINRSADEAYQFASFLRRCENAARA